MRDIVDELRAMAKLWEERKMPWDETTLLHSAAGEIERLRKGDRVALKVSPDQSFAVMVKDLKNYLRGETDG